MQTLGKSIPRVTVVIPTYNRAPLLGRALASVRRQTLTDFEVVVVDDASADDSESVAESFGDPRIRFVRLADRGGAGRARNEGIRLARGELIAFLDSDDEWLAPKLERQVARWRESKDPARTIVYCFNERHDALTGRRVPSRRAAPEGRCFEHLLDGWSFSASVCLAPRSLLLGVGGFDESLPTSEDYDLWLRLARAGVAFTVVREPLVILHHHIGPQLSGQPAGRLRTLRLLDAKWRSAILESCGASAYRRWETHQYTSVQKAQFMRARAAAANGERREAWRQCLAMCRFLPWSRRFFAQTLVLLTVGSTGYGALARSAAAASGWLERRRAR